MGDVAMTVPVVKSLAQQYPDLRITVLSKPFARTLFDGLAPNVSFMGADIKGEYHGIKGLNALYRRLTAKNFTAIADLHSILRSSYLRMRFNFDRYRVAHIDKHRAMRRALTATNNKQLVQLPTPFEGYADVLAQLGYPVNINFTSIFLNNVVHFHTIIVFFKKMSEICCTPSLLCLDAKETIRQFAGLDKSTKVTFTLFYAKSQYNIAFPIL